MCLSAVPFNALHADVLGVINAFLCKKDRLKLNLLSTHVRSESCLFRVLVLNTKYSFLYYRDASFRREVLSTPFLHLGLTFRPTELLEASIGDLSVLGPVHTLNLSRCTFKDVRVLWARMLVLSAACTH